ncbi:hypothetical protein LuPra_05812 [Luteitalea pratensis]|uniref:Uncharacterized protein n=1 Tax=Luteitalea pratensis TaxID=1855912 RepID=A0A143PV22_LUTPR|nr:YMGG-like glycine zipper-containing protein [Luteitalea pratensis]AMY12535.1 hypothetical protein LuPra_05812 [Luteitalea pratensis]
MRRAPVGLALPALMLLAATACGPRSETPPSEKTAAAPAATPAASGTEASVNPAPPETPPAGAPGATTPAAAGSTDNAVAGSPAAAARPPGAPPPPIAPASNEGRGTVGAASTARTAEAAPAPPRPAPLRMVTVPADTSLRVSLVTAVASDTSAVEDKVTGSIVRDVIVDGEPVIPAGSRVHGEVTLAQPSAKVKGRAALTLRFHTVTIGSRSYDIAAAPIRREAEGTKKKDARDIGIGAGAGAVIGGIIGGGKGAAIGAGVGGGAGATKVLVTKGAEVRLPSGTIVTTHLGSPLVVEMPRAAR